MVTYIVSGSCHVSSFQVKSSPVEVNQRLLFSTHILDLLPNDQECSFYADLFLQIDTSSLESLYSDKWLPTVFCSLFFWLYLGWIGYFNGLAFDKIIIKLNAPFLTSFLPPIRTKGLVARIIESCKQKDRLLAWKLPTLIPHGSK